MRIIPAYIEENSPPGEVLVFSSLQNTNRNWVAIHSLDLSPYNNNRRTEVDFVIFIPEHGILCVEVKSQKDIYFDGERWQPDSIKYSPFKQAMNARFAFHRRLKDGFHGRFNHIPVLHCCIFPRSNFDVKLNASIKPFEVMDRRAFESYHTADDFSRTVALMLTRAIDNDPQVRRLQKSLTKEEIEELIDFCYPIRKRKPEKSVEIQRRQSEMEKKLRIQQKPVLNLVTNNDRVLVDGGAGTGKSMIGMEVARRKADEGLRVACLCYNQLIGKWIEREIDSLNQPNLIAGTVYSVLFKLTGLTVPDNASSDWWDNEAPTLIEGKLTDPDLASITTFDYMVIDEAQDILARPALWSCLKLFIGGGLEQGRFLILGDFINQTLTYNIDVIEQNLFDLKSSTTRWLLDENCRNYRPIGEVALTLSGSDRNTWSGYMRVGGALDDWDLRPYKNNAEQVEKVMECIQWARNSGFKDSEITLLTFRAIEKSVIENLVRNGLTMEKASELNSSYIRYSSINSYKGMENKVIIITDVVLSPQNCEMERKVFYTGMTRATEKLFLVCNESATGLLAKWVLP